MNDSELNWFGRFGFVLVALLKLLFAVALRVVVSAVFLVLGCTMVIVYVLSAGKFNIAEKYRERKARMRGKSK